MAFGGAKYCGPADGRSQQPRSYVRPLARALIGAATRVSLEGRENLPASGGNIYCPNHPGTGLDVYIPHLFVEGDLRTMVRVTRFESPAMARFSEVTGAYPVDRTHVDEATKQHSLEVLRQGHDLLLFPEGRHSEMAGQVGRLKRGAASFALKAPAGQVVPVAYHFQADDQARWLETVAVGGLALGAGLVTPGLGGPLVGAAIGSQTGRALATYLAPILSPDRDPLVLTKLARDPSIKAAGSLVGGLIGAALGSLVPNAGSLAAGVGAFSLGYDFIHRDQCKVSIGQPIPVSDYLDRDARQANTDLTEELHRRIGHQVEKLSGVAYDEAAPKIHQHSGSPTGKA
ncbi:MAG: lysophospholipid acyltransferase family protein [Vulcanimicrobiota bacterium]